MSTLRTADDIKSSTTNFRYFLVFKQNSTFATFQDYFSLGTVTKSASDTVAMCFCLHSG